jgi:hypothetical protein
MALLMQALDGQPDSAIIPKRVAPPERVAFGARRSSLLHRRSGQLYVTLPPRFNPC